jgi:hypothetical protein
VVGIAGADDLGVAGHTGRLGVGGVEEDAVTRPHLVAHEVAGLVVADAFPARPPIALEIVDGVGGRFALHQPVAARHRSVQHSVRAGSGLSGPVRLESLLARARFSRVMIREEASPMARGRRGMTVREINGRFGAWALGAARRVTLMASALVHGARPGAAGLRPDNGGISCQRDSARWSLPTISAPPGIWPWPPTAICTWR